MNKFLLTILALSITVTCGAIELTLNAIDDIRIYGGSSAVVVPDACNIDLRGTVEDQIIDNYSSDCLLLIFTQIPMQTSQLRFQSER